MSEYEEIPNRDMIKYSAVHQPSDLEILAKDIKKLAHIVCCLVQATIDIKDEDYQKVFDDLVEIKERYK